MIYQNWYLQARADSIPTMIPIVDFSSWYKPQDKLTKLRVAKQLVDACQTVGFVYIINHSLPESVVDDAFDWSKRLFQLPREEKMKAPHPEGWAIHRGYSWPGLEKVSQVMSTVDDERARRKLREVPDVKVCGNPINTISSSI